MKTVKLDKEISLSKGCPLWIDGKEYSTMTELVILKGTEVTLSDPSRITHSVEIEFPLMKDEDGKVINALAEIYIG